MTMSERPWTKGPWVAEVVADGTQLLDLYGGDGMVIGCPDTEVGYPAPWYHFENPADAKLITLAPEMAEAILATFNGEQADWDLICAVAEKLEAIQ